MLDYSHEKQAQQQGYRCITGVDEVGRGPWAGPVVAAAVVLDEAHIPAGLNDSKKLSAKKREQLAEQIHQTALAVNIVEVSPQQIDQLNIRQATLLAMRQAVQGLSTTADFAFIDGRDVPPELGCAAQSVIKGDGTVQSIAAAAIVAKVYRDQLMAQLHEDFPHYGWDSNAGYGTKTHQEGLAQHGVTQHHRQSFAPIKALVQQAA